MFIKCVENRKFMQLVAILSNISYESIFCDSKLFLLINFLSLYILKELQITTKIFFKFTLTADEGFFGEKIIFSNPNPEKNQCWQSIGFNQACQRWHRNVLFEFQLQNLLFWHFNKSFKNIIIPWNSFYYFSSFLYYFIYFHALDIYLS